MGRIETLQVVLRPLKGDNQQNSIYYENKYIGFIIGCCFIDWLQKAADQTEILYSFNLDRIVQQSQGGLEWKKSREFE